MWNKLAVGLNELMRYLYGGFLALGLASVVDPYRLGAVRHDAGEETLLALAAFSGIVIYAFYRRIFVELVLIPFSVRFERWAATMPGRLGFVGAFAGLQQMGVPPEQCHRAYVTIRGSYLCPDATNRLLVTHAELTMIFITGLELLGAATYLFFHPLGGTSFLASSGLWIQALFLGAGVLLLAIAADPAQLRKEWDEFLEGGPHELEWFLVRHRFMKSGQDG